MILFYSPYIVLGLIGFIVGGISPNMEVLLVLISYIPWSIGYSLGCRFAGFGPGTR
jgi:4-hydroxybenzoate polyprenyltransferase